MGAVPHPRMRNPPDYGRLIIADALRYRYPSA